MTTAVQKKALEALVPKLVAVLPTTGNTINASPTAIEEVYLDTMKEATGIDDPVVLEKVRNAETLFAAAVVGAASQQLRAVPGVEGQTVTAQLTYNGQEIGVSVNHGVPVTVGGKALTSYSVKATVGDDAARKVLRYAAHTYGAAKE